MVNQWWLIIRGYIILSYEVITRLTQQRPKTLALPMESLEREDAFPMLMKCL